MILWFPEEYSDGRHASGVPSDAIRAEEDVSSSCRVSGNQALPYWYLCPQWLPSVLKLGIPDTAILKWGAQCCWRLWDQQLTRLCSRSILLLLIAVGWESEFGSKGCRSGDGEKNSPSFFSSSHLSTGHWGMFCTQEQWWQGQVTSTTSTPQRVTSQPSSCKALHTWGESQADIEFSLVTHEGLHPICIPTAPIRHSPSMDGIQSAHGCSDVPDHIDPVLILQGQKHQRFGSICSF